MTKQKQVLLALVFPATAYCLLFIINIFLADVSFNLGERAKRFGLYETAVEYYQGAVRLNPREPRYHREMASVLASMDKLEGAEDEAEAAYRLNPRNSLTLRSLISTYVRMSEAEKKYQTRAEELAQEVINQQPTNPQLYYQQALILLHAEKKEEAVSSLQKALELKPNYQKARELLESF